MIRKIIKPVTPLLIALVICSFTLNDRNHRDVDFKQSYLSGAMCGTSLDKALFRIDPNDPNAPLFDGMGNHHYTIHTVEPMAQDYFNQGLNLLYGFNHAEAYRSFKECMKIDPYCAMAQWGIAMALGPNLNDGIPSAEREQESFEALQKANALLPEGKEKDLVQALMMRHSDSSMVKRDSLNLSYRDAMQALTEKYSDDLEIKVLYADAIMNTMPWNYYEKDLTAKPWTLIATAILEEVMQKNPDHPGAHHFYIHIVEASDNPDRGVPSADHLGQLVPAAGHLVHMPAHIYARVGRYEDAAESNRKAIQADEDYISTCQANGLYPLGYYPHNIHFLWMAATLNGNSREAIDAAEKTADKIPATATDVFSQIYLAVPLQAYVRFGKWNEILTTPKPERALGWVNKFWHHARSIAFAKKGLPHKSQQEINLLSHLIDSLSQVETDTSEMFRNLNEILLAVPKAELSYAIGETGEAIKILSHAISVEDALPYNEPPNWHHPVRQILGNIYIQSGQYDLAIQAFQDDLKKFRENGWSLFGLYQALERSGKVKEAEKVHDRYKIAWSNADFDLEAAAF